jgi:hypothetical protein
VACESPNEPCPNWDPTRALKSNEEAVNPLFETLSRLGLFEASAMPEILNTKIKTKKIAVTFVTDTVFKFGENLCMNSCFTFLKTFLRVQLVI